MADYTRMTTAEMSRGRLQVCADRVALRVHDARRDRLAGIWLPGSRRTWARATDALWRPRGDGARGAMQRLTGPEAVERSPRRRRGEPGPPLTEQDLDRVLTAARATPSSLAAPE
ncbi:hypothetical protein ACI79J_08525 [Geodermatophilus sp. SYSU D01062]